MLNLTAPPAGEPLLLADAKAALRIDTDADDALLGRIVTVARQFVERRLDLAILRQSWTLTIDAIPSKPVTLRPGKVVSITGGTVRYGEGPARPLRDGEVRLVRSRPACAAFALAKEEGGEAFAAADVTFEAGWLDPASVPAELRHALMLLVAHYYGERQLFAAGRYVSVPTSFDALVAGFREVRL